MVSDFARAHGKSCGLFETGMRDSVDNFYSLLHKVATAEGIDVAIVTTYDGPWTFPTNEVGKADMRRVLALPDVLTSANPGDFAPRKDAEAGRTSSDDPRGTGRTSWR